MNGNIRKIMALVISVSLVVACISGCGVKNAEDVAKKEMRAEVEKAEEMAAPEHSTTAGKAETVYIIKNGDGTEKTIVSAWLKNPSGAESMNDVADLENIEVVKGDAKLGGNENGKITWNAGGSDIYYTGTSEKKVPVDVDITYKLDGKAVNTTELKGKSGHLVMDIRYKNTMSKTVTGKDGKDYTIYMPFIMSTGMILDNAKFSNIKVTNGEAVNDGDHTMIMGIGFPGLYDSLGLDKIDLSGSDDEGVKIEKTDIPDTVTVECDVKDCGELTALTVGKVFDLMQLDKTADTEKLSKDMDDMTDGMKKLIDGSADLHEGISKVNSGAKTLKKGAKSLSDGAGALAKGAGKLASGTKSLNKGAAKLQANNNNLKSGAKSLADGLEKINSKMPSQDKAKELASGSATVKKTIDSMYAATEKVSVSEKEIEAVTAKLKKLVASGDLDEGTMRKIVAVYKSYNGLEKGVAGLHKGYGSINTAIQAFPSLASGIGKTAKGAKSLQKGINSYTSGVDSLSAGIKKVDSGMSKLSGSTEQLAKGAKKLSNGTGTLADGTRKLLKGSGELKDGLKSFDDKAVDKVSDLICDNLVPLSDRFDALKGYSKTYTSFAGSEEGTECSTVFIFKNN